jgi:hypothetical protein
MAVIFLLIACASIAAESSGGPGQPDGGKAMDGIPSWYW